jgi:1A family penicillin-binding protein
MIIIMTNNRKKYIKNIIIGVVATGLFLGGVAVIWLSTLKVPDLKSFEERLVEKSTKIYDRTGEIVLFDFHKDVKRTVVQFSEMGSYLPKATVAIEDTEFYNHIGIRPMSFLRAVIVNIQTGEFSQGGSTITQQIVKNALLTTEKTISRKLKEWVLALKVERQMSKDEILELYLNEAPYGGVLYGALEASQAFFNKKPSDLTLAEASYLAAIPKAPSFYSPYGKNKEKLEARKNLVLAKMNELGFITNEEYEKAKNEVVVWRAPEDKSIKAPHFVFYVREYLEDKYGNDVVNMGGLKVTTTLDYEMQQKAEEIVKRKALENEKKYKAENAGLVAVDPKTGQILVMVGSRDYFDKEIDGAYNIATAMRQPGSAFKPIVYALGFTKGYTPETVLFDVPTEFNTGCNAYGQSRGGVSQKTCYMPDNFDGAYRGPITVREALARSINIPAVKMLYLVGIDNAIKVAGDMGIKSLENAKRYGLTLVLGGGEVRLVDLTSAYGIFATEGKRSPHTPILKIEKDGGTILEEYRENSFEVIPTETALAISGILSDNQARTPTFGANSPMNISGFDVAVKTGTTNNSKDAWIVGYTPNISVGVWAGNNDARPMANVTSVSVAGPIWNEFMREILPKRPNESFRAPTSEKDNLSLKAILRGIWLGGESYFIDTVSGKLATEFTPKETIKEIVTTNVHNILHWVDKTNPRGPLPSNPNKDAQYNNWEIAVRDWWSRNSYKYPQISSANIPTDYDNIHTPTNKPVVTILEPLNESVLNPNTPSLIRVAVNTPYLVTKMDVYVNDIYLGSTTGILNGFAFIPKDLDLKTTNTIRVIVYDSVANNGEAMSVFRIN